MDLDSLLARLRKDAVRFKIVRGKPVAESERILASEVADAIAKHHVDLVILMTAWGNRSGWPKLPKLMAIHNYAIPHLRGYSEIMVGLYRRRQDVYLGMGASKIVAAWAPYLQIIDSIRDVDACSTEPHLDLIAKRYRQAVRVDSLPNVLPPDGNPNPERDEARKVLADLDREIRKRLPRTSFVNYLQSRTFEIIEREDENV